MSYFTAFDRHAYIFSKILRKEVINTVEISKYLGVTRKTIERDLKNITSPINNLNYSIILYGKNRCKKIITQRVV